MTPLRLSAPAAAALALLFAAASLAEDAGPPAETVLELQPGESASLCPCPVYGLICDDPSLVELEATRDGAALRAVKPGTTLCSVRNALGVRRTYRVVVRARR
jgi:hypothetical protein